MVLNRSYLAALAAGALVVLGGSAANAQTPLPNPGLVNPVPTVSFFGGTRQGIAQATFSATAANGNVISGTLTSAVFSGGTVQTIGGNTFGGSALDFYYQFNVTGASTVESFSLSSFLNSTLAVAQTTDDIGDLFVAGGNSPDQAQRNFSGSAVTFDFGLTPVTTGTTSTTMILRTTGTQFSFNGSAAFLGDGVSANSTGLVLAPVGVQAAPEPGTIALLGTGVLGMAGTVIRRRRAK